MHEPSLVARASGQADFDLYPYTPSAAAGWIFVVLFAIAACIHIVLLFFYRSWFFTPLILGSIGEAGGYYGRVWSSKNIRLGGPYLMQLMLILGCAPLIAATVYMTLGRIIRAIGAEKYSIIRVSWMSKIYVLIDIGSFVTQIMGSAMQANSDDEGGRKLGQNLVIGGLGVQLFALSIFVTAATQLHRRMNNNPTAIVTECGLEWRRHMWTLHAVTALVFVRSLFRFIEYAVGHDSVLMTKEAFIYIFDASLMFLVVAILVVFHPGKLVRARRKLAMQPLKMGEERFPLKP